MARELSLSLATFNRYEKGVREPPAGFLARLCRMDNSINPTWLLTGEGRMMLEAQEDLSSAMEFLEHQAALWKAWADRWEVQYHRLERYVERLESELDVYRRRSGTAARHTPPLVNETGRDNP